MFTTHRILASRHLRISLSTVCALAFITFQVWAAETPVPSVVKQAPISTDGTDPKTWDMKRDGVLLAPQNHKVIYEDSYVRVQSVTVPGGTEEPYHLHPYWSVLVNVAVEPTKLINRDASGQAAKNWTFADVLTSPLFIAVSPPGAIHSIKNVGTTPDQIIRVEFKTGIIPTLIHPDWPNGKMPISTDGTDPKTWDSKMEGTIAASDVHKPVFENNNIRVLNELLPAGVAVPFHDHPYPSVMIGYQQSSTVGIDTDRNGKVTDWKFGGEGEGQAAFVSVAPPGGLNSPKILTANPVHVIRIEFKKGFPQ